MGFVRGTSLTEKRRIAVNHGVSILSEFQGLDAALVAVPLGTVLSKQIELGMDPGVAYAEPDYFANASITPNDPYLSSQWNLERIQAGAGWDIYPGNFNGQGADAIGVTIAIVDTGVKVQEDLNDGRALPGANCVNLSSTCSVGGSSDDYGHGTHVAGIAAAATNNLKGIAGISFNSRLMSVKVLDSSGSGTYSAVANGIIWAAQNGAKVINLSLGGPSFSSTMCDAVTSAGQDYSALVVASSGNSGASDNSYPAACPGALAVGSTNEADARSSFSTYGPSLFIAAPGSNINSTLPTCCMALTSPTGYGSLSGTSMASPHVAGLAALIAGRLGGASTTLQDIKIALAQGADKVGGTVYGADPQNLGCIPACTWNQYFGYGRINVLKSLQYNAGPDFTISSTPASMSIDRGQSAAYTINVTRVRGFADPVTLSASGLPTGSTASFDPNPATDSSATMTVSTSASTPRGTYTITVSGTNSTLTRMTAVSLAVEGPDFSLSVSPPSKTVSPGESGNYSIAVGRVGGHSSDVSLSVTGVPASTTAAFSPDLVTGSSSSLTVTTTRATAVGTYQLTITGSSGALTHTANATLIVALVPPGTPQNLIATAGPANGQITLNWSAPTTDGGSSISSYRIFRSTASNTETFLTSVSGDVLTFIDSGFNSHVRRYYKVSATNVALEGATSNEATATTYVSAPPSEPIGLSAVLLANPLRVQVSWTVPLIPNGPITYKVYRGPSSGGEVFLQPNVGTTFIDTKCSVVPTVICYYKVTAVNTNTLTGLIQESPFSNEASSPGTKFP
ncbi:MAG: S8 family serine peptidase [Actinomycetota bacterium]